jgi:hypothetical protein
VPAPAVMESGGGRRVPAPAALQANSALDIEAHPGNDNGDWSANHKNARHEHD